MITIEKEFDRQLNYDLSKLGDPSRILFFDIETTGLSPHSSMLYLIGAVHVKDGKLVLRQWFAESLSQEQAVLRGFFDFCTAFDTLLHFNGDAFDINYLKKCAEEYDIGTPFDRMRSVDILKRIRKHRSLFGLPNLRQKTVEQFLGIAREDRFTGGELIEIYEHYSVHPDERALKLLLLHNEEDLLGMPGILPILNYVDIFGEDFRFTVKELYRNRSGSRLYATLSAGVTYPVPLTCDGCSGVQLIFDGAFLRISLPMVMGEMKYFYPDCTDYYYLVNEDRAIHKKVAVYVEKEFRKNATPQTCYNRMEGFFLPALKKSPFPVFRPAYRAPEIYHRYDKEMFPDYLRLLISCTF